jgi:hypothetical protein
MHVILVSRWVTHFFHEKVPTGTGHTGGVAEKLLPSRGKESVTVPHR